MKIGMSTEQGGIDRTHPINRSIAKEYGVQPALHLYADRATWFGSIHTGSILTPESRIPGWTDQCELQISSAIEWPAIHLYLPSIVENGGYSMQRKSLK